MKRIRLTYLLLVLSCTLFHGSVFAQIMPPDIYMLQVYPTQPSTTDSVFVSLTYNSNDGCPDYYLVKDTAGPTFIAVATRKIDNSKSICTLLGTKFVTKINLGLLSQATKIYVDGALIQTINPNCTLDRKGVVIMGTGACEGKLLISEHTPYASILPYLYSMDKIIGRNAAGATSTGFKPGDEVKFGAFITAYPFETNTCRLIGDALCCEIISTPPVCLMNKTGVVVPGLDGCTGQWFVKDLSPVYSNPRLYQIKNDGSLKTGVKVIFGATDFPKDTTMYTLCPIFGIVNCFFISEPVLPDTLSGTAYTGDSVVKTGMAILFQKGYRKALRSNALQNGRFVFPNLPAADYTVYVIPDRTLNSNYLPTFYINKLAFKNADYYALKDGMNEIAVNLCSFVRRPGTGKIYGNVNFETSNLKDSVLNYYGEKNYLYSTDNNMAINLPVILFDVQGAPIDWTMSDNSGNYAFDNIALDSYRIVTESAESQAESTVSLTPENTVVGADMVLKVQNLVEALPTPQREAFSLYPNPVSDKLYLQTTTSNAVRIYNSLGQLMMEHYLPAGKNELDVQYLNQGVYIVKIGLYTQKLIRK